MSNNTISLTPEFYPIERVLLAGPHADCKPLADRAVAAGHTVTLLLPDEEAEQSPKGHRVLQAGEAVGEEDFDIVVELHCADLEAKAEVLLYLEDALAEHVPIVTLTLAISTGELAREMLIPERVAGVCLLPPLETCALAEIMGAPHTGSETLKTAERFFESIGMSAARVADSRGGVLARAVACLINEAALALQDGVATAEEIDQAMRLGLNYPHGPLAWGDRIGLDRVLAVMDGLYAEFKEERYRPVPLLKQRVRAGFYGERSGRGFFTHV